MHLYKIIRTNLKLESDKDHYSSILYCSATSAYNAFNQLNKICDEQYKVLDDENIGERNKPCIRYITESKITNKTWFFYITEVNAPL